MGPVNDWKALLLGLAAAAGSGIYLARMLLRMNDRSAGADSDGRLLLDLGIIAGLLLLTIREFKIAFLSGLYP